MKRKQIVDLVTACLLIVLGCGLIILPLLDIINIKVAYLVVLIAYAVINLYQYVLTIKNGDIEGLLTTIACVISIGIALLLKISEKPWNLALSLFAWIIMMSLIKLKKSDYYHDRNNKIWILRIITLGLFILVGIITTLSLAYTADVQLIVLGYFFLIHGILELIDPITVYYFEIKK